MQVFLTMFTIQMNERADGRVVFPDADSKVLGQMLEWMYKAKTPDLSDLDVALGLLVVAHRYQLEELQVKKIGKGIYLLHCFFLGLL
jgi:hypothetical protein